MIWSKGVGVTQPKELQLETPERNFHKRRNILRMAGGGSFSSILINFWIWIKMVLQYQDVIQSFSMFQAHVDLFHC